MNDPTIINANNQKVSDIIQHQRALGYHVVAEWHGLHLVSYHVYDQENSAIAKHAELGGRGADIRGEHHKPIGPSPAELQAAA